MSDIRDSARGKDCQLRLPGVCNFSRETVVAAHLRIAGTCGIGMKPSDLLTVRACSACHDVLDGRRKMANGMECGDLMTYIHEGHCRTLLAYEKEGLIEVPK